MRIEHRRSNQKGLFFTMLSIGSICPVTAFDVDGGHRIVESILHVVALGRTSRNVLLASDCVQLPSMVTIALLALSTV